MAVSVSMALATGTTLAARDDADSAPWTDFGECDVLVVGAGTAGVAAALQSALAGARTVAIERGFQVGGTMTGGGICFPGLFHAWGRQIIDGPCYALVTNCVALSGGTLPDFGKPVGAEHWKHQIRINAPLYVALAEEALAKAGVRLLYHAAPVSAVFGNGVWNVSVSAGGKTFAIHARQIVDCTGDATVAALAGFARERGPERQPGTFVYEIDPGVDIGSLDRAALERAFAEALADGRLKPNDMRRGIFGFLKHRGDTDNYIEDADGSTAWSRTRTDMRGRASMLRVCRFLRGVPGLEKATVVAMSPEVGVRETYRVAAEYTVTREDYYSGRVFPDAVCYAFYPIDLHDAKSGIHPERLPEGVVATVPLRALVPKGARNFLVAGRCVGSDREANSGLRVQATCMAMGQAAGAAAACAAARGCAPLEVPLGEIDSVLRKGGAIIPDREARKEVRK